ncbi:KAT8 regulatory NSL complex subunit 2-like [Haliotis cracherodii]|uniref:KAT8 regulatory NSL complex subunit 2-like n=1 Tax=Haliotis cracherodii TaxID=6455 RepID=UPI0039EB89A8
MMRGRVQALRGVKGRMPAEGLFCNYSHRTCMQNRLKDSEYCLKHILEDKNSPFKQCSFVSGKNGKRCPNAAPKSDRKEGYCHDHAKKAAILRQRAQRKKKPRETSESLLEELAHHHGPAATVVEPAVPDPRKSRLPSDSLANKVLDYASSSDSETESPLVDQAWRGDGDSDAESIDSEQEDPLKHAGVYTAEEATLILRDKLIRLQSLYIDQFKRLQHVLKEKRRKYLHTHKQERETLGSIKAYKTDPEQKEKYLKLKALKRYHKRYGKEALLHRSCKQRRIAVSEGNHYRPPSYAKCIQLDTSGVKCSARTLPLSKYCIVHILNDPSQVLYQPCRFENGKCGRPVAPCTDAVFCVLHTPLQEAECRIPLTASQESESVVVTDEKKAMERDKSEGAGAPFRATNLESMLRKTETVVTQTPPTPSYDRRVGEAGDLGQEAMDTS